MEENKNILKLDKISKKDRSVLPKSTSDTLLLLQAGENTAEINILKQIGLDQHISKVEKVEKNLQRFDAFENRFNRKAYSGEQIKKYCLENGYRVVRVDRFKHEIPMEVGKALIQFTQENKEEHERAEGKVVFRDRINLQPSNFFLLTSIQSVNGAKIKAATLFYREEYSHDTYEVMHERDMLVEVFSWGVKGEEASLIKNYLTHSNASVWSTLTFLLLALVCSFIPDTAGIILFLMILSLSSFLLTFDNKFFKWN